jgi:ethanolamine kinase
MSLPAQPGIHHHDGWFPSAGTDAERIAFIQQALNLPDSTHKMRLKQMAGGITNTVYLFESSAGRQVVRVYGNRTDVIIDREAELRNIATIGFISVLATFANGIIVTYQDGRAIDLPMMGDSLISSGIASVVAKFHKVTIGLPGHRNEIFDKIETFLGGLNPAIVDVFEFRARLQRMRVDLEKELHDSQLALCHNDLLAGNILWDGDAREIRVVDFEYCLWTWPEFDIANHFFEWCGFECDMSRFPSVERQKEWIGIYLTHLKGENPDAGTVDRWQRRVEMLVPLSGLFWGYWGFFQDQNSEVQFPYGEYAKIRTMLAELRLPLPEGHEFLAAPLVQV